MPELRIDPLSGLRTIVAGERAARPGRRVHGRAAASRSTPKATRSSRATRTARRLSSTRCAPAAARPTRRAGSSRVVPNLYPALGDGDGRLAACRTRSPRGAASRSCSSSRPAVGAHEVIVHTPEPLGVARASWTSSSSRPRWACGASGCARTRTRRVRARDRQRGPRGRGVAAAHARAAVRAPVRAGGRSRASASASPPSTSARRGATCSRTCCRRRCGCASGSSPSTHEAVVICPFASRMPFQLQIVPRTPRARFEDDGAARRRAAARGAARLEGVLGGTAAVQPLGAHGAARCRRASAGGSTSCRGSRSSPGSSWARA